MPAACPALPPRPAPLAGLLLLAGACSPAPPARVVVQGAPVTTTTTVVVESGCCCCGDADPCPDPDTGGGSGTDSGGDDGGGDAGDDGGDSPCDTLEAPTPYDLGPAVCDDVDLAFLEGSRWCADCDAGEVQLYVMAGNQGGAPSAATTVEGTAGGALLISDSLPALNPGDTVVLGPYLLDTTAWTGTLTLALDPDNTVAECDEGNNASTDMGLSWDNPCL